MKILSSGDWHVNLHKKKVPYKWQENRFLLFFDKLKELEKICDAHIISGDVFDEAPNTDETCLVLSYLNTVSIPTILIPGNHSSTQKGHSFWEDFKRDNSITNGNMHLSVENERINLAGQWFQTFPYGQVQLKNTPEYVSGDILVTHIRGEVAPHITAEFDFEKLRPWKLILLSDLHFNHKYKDYPAYYPGSPLNTTFDRDDKRHYGVDIIELNSIDDYTVRFHNLNLPKLIRRTISVGTKLVADPVHHIVYEVTGTIDELASVEKTELLDKKMVEKPTGNSVLDLQGKSTIEELEIYLDYIKVAEKPIVLAEYKKLGIQ
jgi:DNA repair exonuclease SbcCD nuclease subunit